MAKTPAGLQQNVPLAPYTTMKIGGPAKYFLAVTDKDQVVAALQWVVEEKLPWRVLGAGSNTLISDHGYDGLIIVMKNDWLEWSGTRVVAGAGVTNGQLIASALKNACGGMQWLIGVPGSVGGSLYGNAGGHGWGLGNQVDWVDWIDTDGETHRFQQNECFFTYRHSIFKEKIGIIVQAQLTFPTIDPSEERQRLANVTKAKNMNQPTTAQSAGCMFMNPTVDPTTVPDELRQYIAEDKTLSAWRLIHHVGLSGRQLGQMQISERHANFMVNLGGGTADQVVQLLSLVKQQVRDTLGIQLREEVQYLGF